MDCGIEIYDCKKQDTHASGSGCGCKACSVRIFVKAASEKVEADSIRPHRRCFPKTSYNEGQSVPGIAHASCWKQSERRTRPTS